MPNQKTASKSLITALSKLSGTGAFCSFGEREFLFPELVLAGGEELAFPLPRAQVAAIKEAGEVAPYGKGEATVRDSGVRKCRQVDAADFSIGNPEWDEMIAEIAAAVAEELGVAGKVRATPYKLLLYGEGGHFKPHRDTEKLGAMFGTLVVALPSKHSGGELRVRHAGREQRVRFDAADKLQKVQYAALFADCEHEVRPVKSGHRLCLVYNLTRPKSRKELLNLPPDECSAALRQPLRELAAASPGDLDVVLFDHRYTEKSFTRAALKGGDQARAGALFDAAAAEGLVARLALVSLYKIGELDVDWDPYDYRRRRGDPDDGELGALIEEQLSLGSWHDATDKVKRLGDYAIDRSRLVAAEAIDSGEPDEQFGEGYTGNAGCTMEHWYRRAAVVVWRPEDEDGIAARYRFEESADNWSKAAKRDGAKPGFLSRGLALIGQAETKVTRYSGGGLRANGGTFFALARGVAVSGQPELLERAGQVLLPALVPHADSATLAALVKGLGASRVVALSARPENEDRSDAQNRFLARNREAEVADAQFKLLSALLKNLKIGSDEAAKLAAEVHAHLPSAVRWNEVPLPERVHMALAASHLVTKKSTLAALRKAVLAGGGARRVREVLAPALLLRTHRRLFDEPGSLAGEVFCHCVKVLEAEIAKQIVPFPDWRRPTPPEESDDDPGGFRSIRYGRAALNETITQLHRFLESPDTETSSFPLREDLRDRLAGYISSHQLDLKCRVEKKGSPYSLVCTKTSDSIARARQQQKADRELLTKLEKSGLG